MTDLNLVGESYAHSLVSAGKVDKTSAWSFDAADGNALLGKGGDDWENYSKHHLGLDRSANDKTKARFKYPFAKTDKLYRSGLIAAKHRAAQQNDAAVEKAAAALLELIDKPKSAGGYDRKAINFEFKFSGGDTGSFEGYGSVFNNEDAYRDVMLPGAFTKTLADYKSRGKMPKMLLNHGSMGGGLFGSSDPMADLPIGKWTDMSEDSHGLHTKGQLINLDTERGKTIHGAMKEGQLDGLSIGYTATGFTRGAKDNEPRRKIHEVKLWEVSPVTFPANDQAMVSSVKSIAGQITTVRQFEDFLRDVGGFSHFAAKSIAQKGFRAMESESDARLDAFMASLRDAKQATA
ncbi:HK97 family phage prohead protease [Bradyrhizobium sp. PMVTL-01]|uniref:HK97 family phage prohead protease n=1 Tax=Bradyrhizobium sp. PMVTL-01 TaxID=3434999 RepID=UPI003F72831A